MGDDLSDRLRASVGAFVRSGRLHQSELAEHQAQALGFLMREGPLTVAELAARRRVRHQSMQTAVVELERVGFVTRGPDPRDQRARLVTITSAGLSTLRRELDRRSAVIAAAIDSELDEEERELLERVPDLLQRLAAHISSAGERRS
ncbi:MarR family transcriptional regulator [Nocardioides sp.]|uniref:MarR family winged helix-turn-helix transcriptional regulator n=1 Tax=Nocardioides sp. TaxID=35761 RepID=UPI0025D4443A|nr:MarR family transcriptional regulator [Nocardioides sp.]